MVAVSPKSIPELVERHALLLQRHVGVDRHRDLDSRVTDDLPDDMRLGSKIEQERDASIAEIMETRRTEPGALPDLATASTKIVGLHRRAAAGQEDQAAIFPIRPCFRSFSELAFAMLAERFRTDRREWDHARRVLGLGRDEAQRSADPLEGLDDLQLGAV